MSLRLALGWEGLGTVLRDGPRERDELQYATWRAQENLLPLE